jgi:hypothetical protein
LVRPSFSNSGLPSRSSRRRICIDTADCVRCTSSAALVKLPVSAIMMKVCNWSRSSGEAI